MNNILQLWRLSFTETNSHLSYFVHNHTTNITFSLIHAQYSTYILICHNMQSHCTISCKNHIPFFHEQNHVKIMTSNVCIHVQLRAKKYLFRKIAVCRAKLVSSWYKKNGKFCAKKSIRAKTRNCSARESTMETLQ